ncbi:MAG TPA: preprotein translocase subunit SecA [Candidatus Acidoferrum sp.]|nr:preprotein translocase subunit SecA [Candidatus Acidoferrum sp.]
MGLFDKVFGTYSDRELKKLAAVADQVDALAGKYAAMSDAELAGQTPVLKGRLEAGETTDDILPDAFAAVREAAARVLGMRPYRVQVLGGIVLHQGRIAEMRTGEGKTLVATLPAYLNALTGEGVHIVTVNDYLARRDSEWMGKVYRFMGLSVGLVVHGVTGDEKKDAYKADITYGTNNEFGFDYLRDNMVTYKEQMVQRGHAFAIVDEVDSILVDEARTPLIISGAGEKSTDLYEKADELAGRMRAFKVLEEDTKVENDDIDADYLIDEKARSATLTDKGRRRAEQYFGIENLSDPENATLFHHVNQAIKARGTMKRDVDYVVKDGEIIIVDEFTGRLMFGRRYSEGLHQAIEAKEHVNVQRENRTLATITFQNYFRLYHKLSGMTGTAATEEAEFREIYKLDVVIVPTNMPMIRDDHPDVVYKTEAAKFRSVIENIIACHEKGQPVLVGTISIEKSEHLSALLKRRGVPHSVLNAKFHEKEAEIVAQAGKRGAVTIATNMAGRGTDIILGGNTEYAAKAEMRKLGFSEELIDAATAHNETTDAGVLEARAAFAELERRFKAEYIPEAQAVKDAGGLFIIGTERHESRRIDNQLRGRSGRQGDPGESRFYISMEDDLMRLFGGDRLANMMETLKIDEDTPIEAKLLSGSIESAQRRVEGRNFDIRKHVLQYDDVMNQQRGVIYEQRRKVLDGEDIRSSVIKMIEDVIDEKIAAHMVGEVPEEYDLAGLAANFKGLFLNGSELAAPTREDMDKVTPEWAKEILMRCAFAAYERKEKEYGPIMREVERVVLLGEVDRKWMDHIDAMDELRRGIGLRAIGQRDPVIEYKFEGYEMFDAMTRAIKEDTVRKLYLVRITQGAAPKREQVARPGETPSDDGKGRTVQNKKKKIGPNEPCPCGSGLKYKKCCGKNAR